MDKVISKNEEDVFGKMYLDFYENKGPFYYFMERDDGLLQHRLSETYFQDYNKWGKEEQSLIQTIFENEFTSVLDIGAGAGRVSLYLQNNNIEVISLDLSSGAIEVCKRRGIKNTVVTDIFNYQNSHLFDGILLLGNNLGIGGNYEGTNSLLNKCYELIKPRGQILLHFVSPEPTENIDHQNYHNANKSQGKRIGEITFRMRYRTLVGTWFKLFLPTEEEFKDLIKETGLKILNTWKVNENSFYVQLAKL